MKMSWLSPSFISWNVIVNNKAFVFFLTYFIFYMYIQKKNTKKVYSESLLRLVVLPIWCCSKCLFFYEPFRHGALKLDWSTLFAKKNL